MHTTFNGFDIEITGVPEDGKTAEQLLQDYYSEFRVTKDGLHVVTVTNGGYLMASGKQVIRRAAPFSNLQAALT